MEDAKNSNSKLHEIIPALFIEEKNCIVKRDTTHPREELHIFRKLQKIDKKNDNTRKFTPLEGDYISQTIHKSPEEIRNLDHYSRNQVC